MFDLGSINPIITKRQKKKQKLLNEARSKFIYLNNENTKYEVIPQVCNLLGWKTCNNDTEIGRTEWDVYWTGEELNVVVKCEVLLNTISHPYKCMVISRYINCLYVFVSKTECWSLSAYDCRY
jgi:hypothetical protein